MDAVDPLRELARRLRMLRHRSQLERELEEEMQLHLARREEALRAGGLPAEDARLAAQRRFGNIMHLKEQGVDTWGWRWLEELGQDVRFGLRTLLRSPVFAAAAVLTLGLASGATTAIFSVVNSVLLRPLPFDDPDRLVRIYGRNWREDRGGPPDPVTAPVAGRELDAAVRESTSFEGIAGYAARTEHMQSAAGVERLRAVVAYPSFFDLLGVEAIAGRTFRGDDGDDVAVISEALWRGRFNGDPRTVGTAVSIGERVLTIIGIMPDAFEFPYRIGTPLDGAPEEARTAIWMPIQRSPGSPAGGRLDVFARLKPGVTVERAAAELAVISARIEQEHYQGTRVRVALRPSPLASEVLGQVRTSLWMLLAAVGLVLVTACANVANLLLARMTVRTREVVTRAALGAGRLRLVRQFLAESLVLSLAGGIVGVGIAWWGTDLLVRLYTGRLPRSHEVALDWQAFLFLLGACLVTASLFGLAPAFAAAGMKAHGITKESAGHATAGRRYRHVRDGLAMLEIALAFVLAAGAGIVIREIVRLQRVDTGMTTENVVVLHMTPRTTAADYYAIEDRVRQLPGVRASGFIQYVPLQNSGWMADFDIKGRPPELGQRRVTELRFVTPGYFQALGIPIVKGRGFLETDTETSPRVVLVNEALARRYFPGEDPVGRELDRGTIIGVAGDVRSAHLGRQAEPELYYAVAQNVAMTTDVGISLIVGADGPPESSIAAVRSAIASVNPRLAIFNVRTMEQVLDDSLWQLRLYRWLIGLFAGLALLLAAIGLYGVVAYAATARTREFAIRLALGSDRARLAGLVMRRGLWLACGGLAAGVWGLGALVWWFDERLIGIRPDVGTCAVVLVVLLTITLLACLVPALRTTAVDPVTALRQE
jgi:putative ABC transport system permease protein